MPSARRTLNATAAGRAEDLAGRMMRMTRSVFAPDLVIARGGTGVSRRHRLPSASWEKAKSRDRARLFPIRVQRDEIELTRYIPIATIFQVALHDAGEFVPILDIAVDRCGQRNFGRGQTHSSNKQSTEDEHFHHDCRSLH